VGQHVRAGSDDSARENLWARPEESLLGLLERLVAADVNQMPVVSDTENDGAHIIGMITRDSILRVMQARSEVGSLTPTR